MTVPSDDTAAELLIREVDEDLRHDQMRDVWKRYSALFFAAAIGIVAAVAGWQVWNTWSTKQTLAASDRYANALILQESGKPDDAIKALAALSKDGTAGYRLLAQLKQAEILASSGDTKGAVALYTQVAATSGIEALYRDMATIKIAYITLDGTDPAQSDQLVAPLLAENNSWRFEAREIQAVNALRRQDNAKAIQLYQKLADDLAAPGGIRARAAEMLKTLQPKANG